MPRPRAGARLYLRPDTDEWVLRDSGKPDRRLGLRGNDSRGEAEKVLARYLTAKHELPTRPQDPSDVPIAMVLADYAQRRGDEVIAPERIGHAIDALLPFWGDKACGQIDETSCKAYVSWRVGGGLRRAQIEADGSSAARAKASRSTARRELGVLRAALRSSTRLLTHAPTVHLPDETEPRPDWLTRSQVAAVIWALWTGRYELRSGRQTKRTRKAQHAARLVLCQFYSGSRPATVARTTWSKRKDGPWVDLVAGTWWRRGDEEPATVKARREHGLHPRLLAHLRRWQRLHGGTYIVEHVRHPGMPCLDIGKALETACKRARVPRITPHGMKHTAITLAMQSGMWAEDAADYYSTSIATIQRTYWHHSPHHQDRAIAHVGNLGRRPAQKRTKTPHNARKRERMAAE